MQSTKNKKEGKADDGKHTLIKNKIKTFLIISLLACVFYTIYAFAFNIKIFIETKMKSVKCDMKSFFLFVLFLHTIYFGHKTYNFIFSSGLLTTNIKKKYRMQYNC